MTKIWTAIQGARRGSRGPLVTVGLALLLASAASPLIWYVFGWDTFAYGELVGVLAVPALFIANWQVLRRRNRSRAWLLLWIIGLGIIPLLVAVLARPGSSPPLEEQAT